MDDLISRQEAIAHLKKRLYETQLNNDTDHPYYEEIADNRIETWINELPSAEPSPAECWGCNCPKMERLKEQKTGRWVKYKNWYACSECGNEMFFAGTYDESQHYCYNCGAKMDVERE